VEKKIKIDIYNFYIYIFLRISHYESENKSRSKKLEFANFKRKIKKQIKRYFGQKEIKERDHEQSLKKMRFFYQKIEERRSG
jgi:hypothetical protein